jgi:hypothetical protein
MNIDKILNNPLLSRAAIAKKIWPNNKTAGVYLFNKMHNVQKQTLTYQDKEKIKKIIEDLFADINKV